MPIALVDFEAEYDGEIVRIKAGITHVHPSHELARRFPERFRCEGDAPRAGFASALVAERDRWRSTTPTPPIRPATRATLPPPRASRDDREVPELREDATPKVTVKLTSLARETIRAELDYSRELLERHSAETGGHLFGLREHGVWLLSATRLGNDGRRKPGAVQLGYDEAELAAYRIRLGGSPMRFAGCWHTHPGADGRPSGPDRACSLARLDWDDLCPTSMMVDLILTPDRERGWRAPRFHAWATRRIPTGLAMTEPATLAE